VVEENDMLGMKNARLVCRREKSRVEGALRLIFDAKGPIRGLLIHVAAFRCSQSFFCLTTTHVYGLAKHFVTVARALERILQRACGSWS
jgi:hypothetical protein